MLNTLGFMVLVESFQGLLFSHPLVALLHGVAYLIAGAIFYTVFFWGLVLLHPQPPSGSTDGIRPVAQEYKSDRTDVS